jgi:hypothetical protein
MAGIEKEYFSLEEIESQWGTPHRDLVYLAENGLLKVSIRLYGVHIENGSIEETDDGQWFTIPEERIWFEGLQDLRKHDVYRLFHEGQLNIDRFEVNSPGYTSVLHPEDGVRVRKDELVVRREERDRAASKHGLGGVTRSTATAFVQKNNFAEVTLGDTTYILGPIQARVVEILYDAATTEFPWLHGQRVLAEAGSKSTRLSDLFKKQPEWRKLIQSDKRGKYRLNIQFS